MRFLWVILGSILGCGRNTSFGSPSCWIFAVISDRFKGFLECYRIREKSFQGLFFPAPSRQTFLLWIGASLPVSVERGSFSKKALSDAGEGQGSVLRKSPFSAGCSHVFLFMDTGAPFSWCQVLSFHEDKCLISLERGSISSSWRRDPSCLPGWDQVEL